ncbi:uncharacterized protein [Anoplolepis gracilipes]|uniref:uncharacterized protein isoform X1 n=1 Tax=Anoplolepis gracilipes TaxID=354296 RepID=UPI003B9EBE45
MPTKNKNRDEIRTILLSLLIARPGPTPVVVLDQDYYREEGERIPWRKLGYTDVVEFLKSMPEHFSIERFKDVHYVRGIASEKTKHVSSLVSRQKKPKYLPSYQFRQRSLPNYVIPQRQRLRIPAEQLSQLVTFVKNNPTGVSLRNAMQMLQTQLPHTKLSINDIQYQLRELSHSLYIDRDMIYPLSVNDVSQEVKNCPQPSTEPQKVPRPPVAEMVGGDEGSDFLEDFSDEDFGLVDYVSSNYPNQSKTNERLATNFAWRANNEQSPMFNRNNDVDVDEYFAANNTNCDTPNTMITDSVDLSTLISKRMKSRLDDLMRDSPEGIWCADLPEKYLNKYKVNLNYAELGFNSVREYVSYLPDIFYMTRTNSTEDFLLYSADKRPIVPDQVQLTKTEPIEIKSKSHQQYDEHIAIHIQHNDDNAPIPADVSPTITKTFAPDDVMNYNDSVDQILVTELQLSDKKYLEVYIVEIFNPSFFWIHLRDNKKEFDRLMDDLSDFYDYKKDKYTIPKIALKKGLNCACVYANRWHRGIIRSVKPDFKVTVLFYDYGTLKTYASEDVYYLHKQFSFRPAQAIPCGLYNVRPCIGDRWKKSVTDQLIDRINETLLALTIVSVDPLNNSMMVILSDTSDEVDVHINEWLIKEKLARYGKMVRMYENFSYLHYSTCNNTQSPMSTSIAYIEISDTERDTVNLDETRHDRNQSIACNKGMNTLFDVKKNDKINVKSENKTVEVLRNVSSSKKALLQKLRDINSLDARSSDFKSQSTNYSKNEKPSGPSRLALFQKLKTLNVTSNSNSSISEPNYFKDNVQQIDSDTKADLQNDNENKNCVNMDSTFSLRDSDNEENNEKDFGTFRSLYGGRGLMKPFDWSIIKKNDTVSHETTVTSHNNLDNLIKEYKSNITEEKSESHKFNNKEKESLPANSYFLNITRKEEEYYLPEKNINYDFKNVSQSVARLRNKMEIHNDKYTTVIVPRNVLEILCDDIQSQNTLSSDTNTVKTNGVASSIKETALFKIINENGEIKTKEKIEKNRDFDADMKSISSDMVNNEDCINKITKINNKKTFECNTDSLPESSTNGKGFSLKYKTLENEIKHMQMNSVNSSTSTDISNTRDSPSSEQIQSSSSSHRSSTTSSIISSDDEQHKDFKSQSNVRFSKLSPTSSNDFLLDCNFKETRGLLTSDNDSVVSFNLDDSKKNQPVEINAITSNIDNSKQPNMLELVLKNAENVTSNVELNSDDLSNQENDINDKSCDKEKGELVDELVIDRIRCKSMNNDISMPEKLLVPPVLDDCDIESDDEEWDSFVPEPFFQKIFQSSQMMNFLKLKD